MDVIEADHNRTVQLTGVPDAVPRPVDIDQARTGFKALRSLRIYRFLAGSVVDGRAEEDEVLMVVLAGSVQLSMSQQELEHGSPKFVLSAVSNTDCEPCVAYLPPHGAYRLVPLSDAEVAYARATTATARLPKVFCAERQPAGPVDELFIEESRYATRLRLRVIEVRASAVGAYVVPVDGLASECEALVHVRTSPARGAASLSTQGSDPVAFNSSDTIAVPPRERPTIHLAANSSALILVTLACGGVES